MRLKIPGGVLTTAQLRAIARIVSSRAEECADLTTGWEIQLPGIADADLPPLLDGLAAAGLSVHTDAAERPAADADAFGDSVGVHEQQQAGLFSIGIPVLAGRLSATQMRKVADVVERHGDGTIHLTAQQGLLFLNVPKENVASILEGLEPVGLKAGASALSRSVLACAEKEFCRQLIQHLEGRVLLEEPLQIHVSDGFSRCLHPTQAQIELQRNSSGFDIAVASGPAVLCRVPSAEVKIRLEQLLVGYKKQKKAGESFGQFCQRVGDGHLAKMLEPA